MCIYFGVNFIICDPTNTDIVENAATTREGIYNDLRGNDFHD